MQEVSSCNKSCKAFQAIEPETSGLCFDKTVEKAKGWRRSNDWYSNTNHFHANSIFFMGQFSLEERSVESFHTFGSELGEVSDFEEMKAAVQWCLDRSEQSRSRYRQSTEVLVELMYQCHERGGYLEQHQDSGLLHQLYYECFKDTGYVPSWAMARDTLMFVILNCEGFHGGDMLVCQGAKLVRGVHPTLWYKEEKGDYEYFHKREAGHGYLINERRVEGAVKLLTHGTHRGYYFKEGYDATSADMLMLRIRAHEKDRHPVLLCLDEYCKFVGSQEENEGMKAELFKLMRKFNEEEDYDVLARGLIEAQMSTMISLDLRVLGAENELRDMAGVVNAKQYIIDLHEEQNGMLKGQNEALEKMVTAFQVKNKEKRGGSLPFIFGVFLLGLVLGWGMRVSVE